jgi:hypothetical protein
VERRFSFVLKTAILGGVVQRGSIVGYVMFDVRKVVELSSVCYRQILTKAGDGP